MSTSFVIPTHFSPVNKLQLQLQYTNTQKTEKRLVSLCYLCILLRCRNPTVPPHQHSTTNTFQESFIGELYAFLFIKHYFSYYYYYVSMYCRKVFFSGFTSAFFISSLILPPHHHQRFPLKKVSVCLCAYNGIRGGGVCWRWR